MFIEGRDGCVRAAVEQNSKGVMAVKSAPGLLIETILPNRKLIAATFGHLVPHDSFPKNVAASRKKLRSF